MLFFDLEIDDLNDLGVMLFFVLFDDLTDFLFLLVLYLFFLMLPKVYVTKSLFLCELFPNYD